MLPRTETVCIGQLLGRYMVQVPMSWLIEHLGVGLKYLQKVYKWKEYNIKSQYKAKSKTLSLKKNNYNNQKRREQHEIKEN